MSLRAKYKLRTPVGQGAAAFDQLIEGEEAATGRLVSIHILAGGSSLENQKLLREIEELPREYKIVFLEIGEQDGNPFIVTDALSGAPAFRKWFYSLQAKVGKPIKPGTTPRKDSAELLKPRAWQIPVQVNAPAPSAAQTAPGDFTRMFEVAEVHAPSREGAPAAAASLSPEQPGHGEFTQMFQFPAASSKPASQVATELPADSVSAQPAPGEFTQLFRTPVPDSALPDTGEPAQASQGPGEFTQLLKAPQQMPANTANQSRDVSVSDEFSQLFELPAAPVQPPPAVHSAKDAPKPPGEFTQLFQAQPKPIEPRPKAVAAVPPPMQSGEFTQLFQTPPTPAPASSVVYPVQDPSPSPRPPGEFTSLFQAPVITPKPSAAAPVPQPPPVAKQPDPDATLIFHAPAPTPQKARSAPAAPGEFTQMFAAPQSPVAPSRPRDRPAASLLPSALDALFNQSPSVEEFPATEAPPSKAGEFTRMMESPLARSGLKPQSPAAAPPERFSMKSQSSGFTQMLESPVSPYSDAPSMPAPSRQETPSGDATRAFRFPEAAPEPPPSASDAPPPPAGPSEFTQMFKAPGKKEDPKPVKPAAKSARVTPRRKPNTAYLKWILAASAILLILAIIVFFAVRD